MDSKFCSYEWTLAPSAVKFKCQCLTCTLWRPRITGFLGLWKQSQVQNYHGNSLLNFNSTRICMVKSSLSAEIVACWDLSTFIVHFYLIIRHLNTHEYILHFRCRLLHFCKKNCFDYFERTKRTKEVCQDGSVRVWNWFENSLWVWKWMREKKVNAALRNWTSVPKRTAEIKVSRAELYLKENCDGWAEQTKHWRIRMET